MKAPKNLYNKFGKFNYRNVESILEAFKPLGHELGLVLTLTDELVSIGDRVYIKAVATLTDTDSPQYIPACAYARESDAKKGFDEPQLTGTASSYARKYALNGLLLLDDSNDPDTNEYHEQTACDEDEERSKTPIRITAKRNTILSACAAKKTTARPNGYMPEDITNGRPLDDLSEEELDAVIDALHEKKWIK